MLNFGFFYGMINPRKISSKKKRGEVQMNKLWVKIVAGLLIVSLASASIFTLLYYIFAR